MNTNSSKQQRFFTLELETTKSLLRSMLCSRIILLHMKQPKRQIFQRFGRQFASLVLEPENSRQQHFVVFKLSSILII